MRSEMTTTERQQRIRETAAQLYAIYKQMPHTLAPASPAVNAQAEAAYLVDEREAIQREG